MTPLFSCVGKRNAERLAGEKDSLSLALAAKDSVINEVFASLNDIAENLNAIKVRENIITTAVGNGEIRKQATVQIGEDIEEIDRLLQSNRETIARLERSAARLKKADVKVASLEKLIGEMSAQVETKDAEIAALRKDLKKLNVEVEELHTQVSGLGTEVDSLNRAKNRLEGEVKTRDDLLSVAYYIVGSQKELLEKEIVYKSGFIGRTLKINENRSLDSFTQVDIRNFDEVIIGKRDVVLVSSHPAGSYEFVMNDNRVFSSLVITDRDKFWEYSKVLVISYK
ncbi:hypothetical protein INF32_01805 [Rikenellaceae bacterium DSM 108975]|nr:hypothetical protein [Gallalistipes aquisgranensis]